MLELTIVQVKKNKTKNGQAASYHHKLEGPRTVKKTPLGEMSLPGKTYWIHLDKKNVVSKKVLKIDTDNDFKIVISQYEKADEDTGEIVTSFSRVLKMRADGDDSENESLAEARQAYAEEMGGE